MGDSSGNVRIYLDDVKANIGKVGRGEVEMFARGVVCAPIDYDAIRRFRQRLRDTRADGSAQEDEG
jgi:hypothetical protein